MLQPSPSPAYTLDLHTHHAPHCPATGTATFSPTCFCEFKSLSQFLALLNRCSIVLPFLFVCLLWWKCSLNHQWATSPDVDNALLTTQSSHAHYTEYVVCVCVWSPSPETSLIPRPILPIPQMPYFSCWCAGCGPGCTAQPTARQWDWQSVLGRRLLQRWMLSGFCPQLEGWAWLGCSVSMMAKWQVIFLLFVLHYWLY